MCTIQPNLKNERRSSQKFLVQLQDLFLMELTNWRWSWRIMLLSGTITPLFSVIILGVFVNDSGGEKLAYVVTGNIVVGLLFGTMKSVQRRVI